MHIISKTRQRKVSASSHIPKTHLNFAFATKTISPSMGKAENHIAKKPGHSSSITQSGQQQHISFSTDKTHHTHVRQSEHTPTSYSSRRGEKELLERLPDNWNSESMFNNGQHTAASLISTFINNTCMKSSKLTETNFNKSWLDLNLINSYMYTYIVPADAYLLYIVCDREGK